jgi:hypothetical protein
MPSLPFVRRTLAVLLLLVLTAPLMVRGASADPLLGAGALDAYTIAVDRAGLPDVANGQYDILAIEDRDGGYEVTLALRPEEAAELGLRGVVPQLWRDPETGLSYSQSADVALQEGFEVYRPYDGEGGIAEELERLVVENPDIVERVVIGTTHQGREILALRVTRDANDTPQGSRPATLFNSLQHAREWIALETNRRLLHYFLDNDGVDEEITALIDSTEIWFVVVANPDGYQHTHTEGNRLWRKNLRDNDGDGEITGEDGVDPNRNFDSRWNYDMAGSSGNNRSSTYRGPEGGSEPMVKALQDLLQRIDFGLMLNFHSAAELLLWPDGWQDETRTADDPIYSALAGDFFDPAVEGFEPMLSAGLYITNGETCDYAHAKTDTLCYTPELSTPPSGTVPPGTSGFEFPDDEALIQAEFELNLPFSLSIAKSSADPTRPVSVLGRSIEPIYVDHFAWSYGSPQWVQANVMRRMGEVTMYYRINEGPTYRQSTAEWQGGKRYGADGDVHFRRVRGMVVGAEPGDDVTVWFEAEGEAASVGGSEPVSSEPFTYEQVSDTDFRVLVVAAEDYTGLDPDYGDVDGPPQLAAYEQALSAADLGYDVYDFDARDRVAPSPLGVLSHYDAVIWYSGDDRALRDQGMEDGTVSREARDMQLAMRDYINEGGKLWHLGQFAGRAYAGGFEFDPFNNDPCERGSGADGCETLKYDFFRYYLGAYDYDEVVGVASAEIAGQAGPFEGLSITLGGDGVTAADRGVSYRPTADVMPAEDYPLFAAIPAASWTGGGFQPLSGDGVLYSGETAYEYQRVGRTLDLSAATGAALEFGILRQSRQPFDAVIVEARTVGEENWTTLPDVNGHTTRTDAASCWSETWFNLFPQLAHYMTPDDTVPGGCRPDGTTGEWHAATGGSEGWETWRMDLSAYAGQEVELHLTYLSSRTAFPGVYVDDMRIEVDGATLDLADFETDLGMWEVSGLPANGEDPEAQFELAGSDVFPELEGNAILVAKDSVLMGFGLEAVGDPDQREELLRKTLLHFEIDPSNPPEPPQDPEMPPLVPGTEPGGLIYLPMARR